MATALLLADSVSLRAKGSAEVRTAVIGVRAAAAAAGRAIDAVNRALTRLATARFGRDDIGRQWNANLSALRHAAAASPELRLAQRLFLGIRRPKKRPKRKAPSE